MPRHRAHPMPAIASRSDREGRRGASHSVSGLAQLQRLADDSLGVRRLSGLCPRADTGDRSSAGPLQRLSKAQRRDVDRAQLTDDFKAKHVAPDASRKTLMDMAASRNVPASTLIRASATKIEAKAKSVAKTGDDQQVAAEKHPRYGPQLKIRLTGLERGTISRGVFQSWSDAPFVVVGAWTNKTAQGNHFQADPKVGANDDEVFSR